MRDWVFHELENFYRADREKLLLEPPTNLKALKVLIEDDAIEEAERGDLTKLRLLFHPKFHPFLQSPRKRGRRPYSHRPNVSSEYYDYPSRVRMAKLAVPIIRQIWREHYRRARRRPEDGFAAYEIAAAYFDINDAEEVAKPPSGKRKKIRDK
jgi:hypothetical protein